MSRITFQIEYAGLTLPVVKNQHGEDATPLKPIVDLFGLGWQRQRQKLFESAYYTNRFGISEVPETANSGTHMCTSRRSKNPTYLPEVLIRLDRVAAYLNTINPEKVRAAGNEDGAAFLMRKQEEWDDALHDYEAIGVAVNLNHERTRRALRAERLTLLRAVGTLNKTENSAARQSVLHLIGQMCQEQGVPFQHELPTA